VDVGISCRELERRLSLFGVEPTQIEGVLLTHEHTDHTRGVKRFCADHKVMVYGTRGTLALTSLEGVASDTITAGSTFQLNGLTVRPFKVKHMAAEPVGYSISTGQSKVSIASDLGSVTPGVVQEMRGSRLMLVEANYDEDMLVGGDYPEFLKRAIKSDHGHLSNADAGALSLKSYSDSTEAIVLVHLSKENNTPEKAREAVEAELRHPKNGPRVDVVEHGGTGGPYRLA
jgi:phosphoribosyl 1,2-cyclic phosphodiesterase